MVKDLGLRKPTHDYQIDVYRALMMIYVPCVIHVLYWLGKGNGYINSALLFEMPVIFYISGATMYVTGKNRTLKDTVVNRAKRILLPYVFFILGCFVILIVCKFTITDYSENKSVSILKIITIHDGSLPVPYMWHIWFIVPYLIVSCSFAIQKKWADKINRYVYMIILLGLCATGPIFTSIHPIYMKPIREALFYNFFFISGYLFYKQISFKILLTMTLISGIIMTTGIWYCWSVNGSFSMDAHKFPPDFLFIAYGVFALCILALVFGNFNMPLNRLFHHWNKYGYTIYLWQNFSFIMYDLTT